MDGGIVETTLGETFQPGEVAGADGLDIFEVDFTSFGVDARGRAENDFFEVVGVHLDVSLGLVADKADLVEDLGGRDGPRVENEIERTS